MLVDESISMSNLTSPSNEASISSSNNNKNQEIRNMYPQLQHQQSFASTSNIQTPHEQPPPPPKKKRNLPGNPDPEAEVVALSPKSLLATNRFVCEICNKGFQRDQNLQLHRRGHNLPWKLKQRNNKEVIKKKVYVCPEPSCVHHDPSRALGDLTGIKKHFCRKHGEKKWKCDKCSKKYAVQSDWKAHSKICGTREYRCDCGTLFSRRDSFITHRAFCDALAEESSRSMTLHNPIQTAPNPLIHLKQESQSHPNFNLLPPWLSPSEPPNNPLFTSTRAQSSFHQNPNSIPPFPSASLMSATALLQKAAQMGVTMSSSSNNNNNHNHVNPSMSGRPGPGTHHHVGGAPGSFDPTAGTGIIPTREEMSAAETASFGDKAMINVTSCMETDVNMMGSSMPSTCMTTMTHHHHHVFDTSSSSQQAFDHDQDNFNRILLNHPSFQENAHHFLTGRKDGAAAAGGDGLTRDFLGLRGFPHGDHEQFMNMAAAAGLDHHHHHHHHMGSSSYGHGQNQNPATWQG